MNIRVLAELGGALVAAGLVAAIYALIGTDRPRTVSSQRSALQRWWSGEGLTAAQRRSRRVAVGVGVAAGAGGWLVTGMPVAGLLLGVAVPGVPWLLVVGRAERRVIARIEAVGEWIRRLRDIATTGTGLQQAIVASAVTAPAEIAEDVRTLAARLQAGWEPRLALHLFADTIADPVADQAVAALILNIADRGEYLSDVLASIAAGAAAEVATRREVDAKRTQPRFAVKFLTVMTVVVVAYGSTRAEYMRPYATPVGQLVMLGLGGAFVALLAWTRALCMPPRVHRFLRTPHRQESSS